MTALAMIAMLALQDPTAPEVWEARAELPAATDSGASMTSCLGFLYLTQGGGSMAFRAYDPAGDVWMSLADLPVGAAAGTAMASDGIRFVYAVAGDALFAYDITVDTWTRLSPLPHPLGWGGAVAHVDGSLYVLFGGTSTQFRRFDIGTLYWVAMPDTPAPVGQGGCIAVGGGFLHVLRGGNSDDRWTFDLSGATWAVMDELPQTVSAGGWITIRPDEVLDAGIGGGRYTAYMIDDYEIAIEGPPLPVPQRAGSCAAILGDHLYVHPGKSPALLRRFVGSPSVVEPAAPSVRDRSSKGGCSSSAGAPAGGLAALPLALVAAETLRRRRASKRA